MKKVILILAALLSAAGARAGQIVSDSIQSKVLGAEVKYNVYLPDGFETSGKSYPVVYLLHGLSDNYNAWKDKGAVRMVADELIGTGEADEMVIVMPNAGDKDTHNVPNGYFNMPGWNYEDFFFTEFLPAVEKKYRVIGDKSHRAIMGLSMGGGGSTVYSQRHPDMFSSCYAMSAWLDYTGNEVRTDENVKDWRYLTCKSVRDHSAIDFITNADEGTLNKLRTVAWYIDCGDDDFLLDLSVLLHQKMRDSKVKSELRVRNGIHNWEYWHGCIRTALPFASRNFGK